MRLSQQLSTVAGTALRALSAQRWYAHLGNMLDRRHPLTVDRTTVNRQCLPYGVPGFLDVLPALLAGIDPGRVQASTPNVTCPVLLLWGTADRLAGRSHVLRLTAGFRDAEPVLSSIMLAMCPRKTCPMRQSLRHILSSKGCRDSAAPFKFSVSHRSTR